MPVIYDPNMDEQTAIDLYMDEIDIEDYIEEEEIDYDD